MAKKTDKPAKAAAPPTEKEAPEAREIVISRREVQVTNLNHSPEKAGKQLVEKCDVSIGMELEQGDLDLFVKTNGQPLTTQMYDKEGNLLFPEISSFPVELQCDGACSFAPKGSKKDFEFDDAVLKKPHLTLRFGRKGTLTCQVRVAPGTHLGHLGKMRIEGSAVFQFNGSAQADEDSENQGDLNL